MSLALSLQSRGATATLARTKQVVSRFGATTSAMARRLDRFESIAAAHGVLPTWPTTACVLERHPALLRRYAERGVELALHGLVHGDHAAIDAGRQRETIAHAIELFERSGLRPLGFRGPYLRYNDDTLAALRALGLRYHSSQAFVFQSIATNTTPAAASQLALALRLYGAVDARTTCVRPRSLDGLVDIPVAVPDDEILLDRLRLSEPALSAEWLHILGLTHARGDLFTIQLHPERIPELGEALEATLRAARALVPAVYFARLDGIADWWLRRSRFVLRVTRAGETRCRVSLSADPDATLLIRGLDTPAAPWHGRDLRCVAREFEAEAERLPIVGVSRRTTHAVTRFLVEEGFATETSDDRGSYGAYVDVPDGSWTEVSVLDAIEAGPGPLARIWRWPDGARSALAVTGDIDALTLRDFMTRSWETRGWNLTEKERGA
jgi:peptidoglycan/xylan/chitin deacetylase (PgdA/CDA1 family)